MARWLIFPLLIKEIRSIKYLFKDKEAPRRYKAAVIAGLIYLFSPIDLIPAPVLGFSIIDDLVIWGFLLSYLKEPLEKYKEQYEKDHPGKKKSGGFRTGSTGGAGKGKTVIRDVPFTVKDAESEKQDTDGDTGSESGTESDTETAAEHKS